jgi:hypothetical protein
MNQKIWNLQDSTKFRSEILIWIYFKPRADTWLLLIAWYRFVQINDVSRRIESGVYGLDLRVPVHLSELIWEVRFQSNGWEEKGE